MNSRSRRISSMAIGLGVPALALFIGIPVFGSIDATVWGFPMVFFWLFCCFPLTTVCLALSWYLFDRHDHREE